MGQPPRSPMTIRSTSALVFHVLLRLAFVGALAAAVTFGLLTACAKSEPAGFQPSASTDADAPDADEPFQEDPSFGADGSAPKEPKYPLHPPPPPHGTVSAGTVPSNAGALFANAQLDPSAVAPALAYPTPETMFP